MNLDVIHMVLGTLVAAHISQLHAAMLIHMQDPQSKFHNVIEWTRTLLCSLPFAHPWFEFRLRNHDFMITGEEGADEERFLILGV